MARKPLPLTRAELISHFEEIVLPELRQLGANRTAYELELAVRFMRDEDREQLQVPSQLVN